MSFIPFCPNCGKPTTSGTIFQSGDITNLVLCDKHLEERRAKLKAQQDQPVGGLSCTDEDEKKMQYIPGFPDCDKSYRHIVRRMPGDDYDS